MHALPSTLVETLASRYLRDAVHLDRFERTGATGPDADGRCRTSFEVTGFSPAAADRDGFHVSACLALRMLRDAIDEHAARSGAEGPRSLRTMRARYQRPIRGTRDIQCDTWPGLRFRIAGGAFEGRAALRSAIQPPWRPDRAIATGQVLFGEERLEAGLTTDDRELDLFDAFRIAGQLCIVHGLAAANRRAKDGEVWVLVAELECAGTAVPRESHHMEIDLVGRRSGLAERGARLARYAFRDSAGHRGELLLAFDGLEAG